MKTPLKTVTAFLLTAGMVTVGPTAEARSAEPGIVGSLLVAAADTSLKLGRRKKIAREAAELDKTGRAMHALARLYLSEGSASSPSNSERWIVRAIKREPRNPEYYVTYAKMFWRTGQRDNAFSKLKQALELDPGHVPALYWAGQYSAEEMFRNLERDGGGLIFPVRGNQHGKEMREAAVFYLTHLLQADPEHRPGRLLLGSIYFEGYMTGELISLFREYGKRHPEDPDPYFFIGLGHEKEGRLDSAFAEYQKGLERLSPEQNRFVTSVYLVAEPGEEVPDVQAVRRYWDGRDPLFLTDVNERLMEHCRRVAYANLKYGEPGRRLPGWETDRGQAYIRYGQPGSRNLSVGVAYLVDIWYYEGFQLAFGNTSANHWRFLNALVKDKKVGSLSSLVRKVGQHFRNPYWWEQFDIPVQAVQFRGDQGRTRVEIYYALPGEEIVHKQQKRGIHEVDLLEAVFLFDDEWRLRRGTRKRLKVMPWVEGDGIREGYLLGAERLQLEPNRVHLAVEVKDRASDTIGILRDTLDVRDFSGKTLDISELLIARRIVVRDTAELGRASYRVLSNPLRRVQRDESAYFYFEIYNLVRDEFGVTRYAITYRVKRFPEGTDGSDAEWSTAVSDTLNGTRSFEPHYLALDMEESAPGRRTFQVIVTDLHADQKASTSESFRVMW